MPVDNHNEFDVADFNKRFEMTYSSTQYREDLRLDLGWVKPIEQALSNKKMLMYKRPYYHLLRMKNADMSMLLAESGIASDWPGDEE